MNKLTTAATAFAAGLLAMYLFDETSGRRRRALWRDRAWSGARSAIHRGERQARHLGNPARRLAVTGHLDRHSHRPPENDHQLHERIRAQLGRVVSHPHAIHLRVMDGAVTLTGHVLRHEVVPLLNCVRAIAGVKRMDNRLEEHPEPGNIPSLQGTGRLERAQTPDSAPARTAYRATEWQ